MIKWLSEDSGIPNWLAWLLFLDMSYNLIKAYYRDFQNRRKNR